MDHLTHRNSHNHLSHKHLNSLHSQSMHSTQSLTMKTTIGHHCRPTSGSAIHRNIIQVSFCTRHHVASLKECARHGYYELCLWFWIDMLQRLFCYKNGHQNFDLVYAVAFLRVSWSRGRECPRMTLGTAGTGRTSISAWTLPCMARSSTSMTVTNGQRFVSNLGAVFIFICL